MYTDPEVVRRKVDRELRDFVERIDHYRARGIWVLEYRFPTLLVAFTTPNLKPHAIAPYGVLLDLSNYDVEPPSVTFVNPFTRVPLKGAQIPTVLRRIRLLPSSAEPTDTQPTANGQHVPNAVVEQLLVYWPQEQIPFVCLQGVREYHENPGHTGDPWWLHRGKGAGRIIRLLDLISKYGTEAMTQLQFKIDIQIVAADVVDPA
ncbi:MAG: hypothetical protein JWQ07_4098 [Ramlibacter sp.]|nr:hypothetical protein [Ramlibacter sp.]